MNFRAISESAPLSESLASISLGAEVLFWRMVSQADPWGCLPGNARKVHHQCLGLRAGDYTTDDVRGWLEELKRAGRIARRRNGVEYIELLDWDRWQPENYLRQRGPSDHLHPNGNLEGETRPHDKRKSRARDGAGRFLAQPSHPHQKPKNGVQKRTEQNRREENEKSSSRASSRSSARADGQTADRTRSKIKTNVRDAIDALVRELNHSDRGTESVLIALDLPEAAYRSALEALIEMRAKGKTPTNDAGWVVTRLNAQIIDGIYRRGNG